MGWKPGTGFSGFPQWRGYNEAMILYVLALGSPTHPIPRFGTRGSAVLVADALRLQLHQLPAAVRNTSTRTAGRLPRHPGRVHAQSRITYFENSRRATLAQREYCIDNPLGWNAYSDSLWGLTASDDPSGYAAHGAPPGGARTATITPDRRHLLAALCARGRGPADAQPVGQLARSLVGSLRVHRRVQSDVAWVGQDVLGIDQGPIVLMIENYRSEAVWRRFSQNEWIASGLTRAGFLPVTTDVADPVASGAPAIALRAVEPTPFRDGTTVRFRLAAPGRVHARPDRRARTDRGAARRPRVRRRGPGAAVDGSRLAPGSTTCA